MKPFIKAYEIWAPLRDPMLLEFVQGHYGDLGDFESVSKNKVFAYDAGLPGKAWSSAHPIILRDLQGSYFERGKAAASAGITAAIAIPIFAGQCLLSVLVFLCGDDDEVAGAIELWHCDEKQNYDLDLLDGYFGKLDHFEFVARHTSFRKGMGLPGIVWESAMPKVLSNLGSSHRFIRSKDAEDAGITAGLGIPFTSDDTSHYVMTFLSALGTPIARQIELWNPTHDGKGLMFADGFAQNNFNLFDQYSEKLIVKGEGVIGRTYLSGKPEICENLDEIYFSANDSAKELHMTSLVTIPVLQAGSCRSIIALYL